MDIFDRARNGDQEAWTEIYRKYKRYGLSAANKYLIDKDDAEGVTDEAFIRCVKSFDSNKGEFHFYLYTGVKQMSLSLNKKLNTQKRQGITYSLDKNMTADEKLVYLDAIGYDEDFSITTDITDVLKQVIKKFPPQQRKAIKRYLKGDTFRTAAQKSGYTLRGVCYVIDRFRQGMKDELIRTRYWEAV